MYHKKIGKKSAPFGLNNKTLLLHIININAKQFLSSFRTIFHLVIYFLKKLIDF